jgi:hypothetical protein
MEYLAIILVSLGAALLTFFSGFGLGTILMPVFALIFPVELAIALTAIVHLANNIFKGTLVWKHIRVKVVLRFGIPAAVAAFGGALLLNSLSTREALFTWYLGERLMTVTLLKLVIAVLLALFAILEIDRRMEKISLGSAFLPVGGVLSGFFGGLSGHQGALRSVFLLKAGLGKEGFIATGIAIAIVIDISRLSVYGSTFFSRHVGVLDSESLYYLIAAVLAAFAGSLVGRRILKKITFRSVQLTVGILILGMALLMGTGFI